MRVVWVPRFLNFVDLYQNFFFRLKTYFVAVVFEGLSSPDGYTLVDLA